MGSLNIKEISKEKTAPEIPTTPPPKPKNPLLLKKKLNIKPIDIPTNSTNLKPLPPLPFCPSKKKIIIKNIPKIPTNASSEKKNVEPVSKPETVMAPLPIKKLTIKDVLPVPNSEKTTNEPKNESKVDPLIESRLVKPLSIKLQTPPIPKPQEEPRPALKLSMKTL